MDTPQFQRIKFSRSGRTAVLALASDKVNALDREVLQEISTFVEFCEQDPGIGALVVTGEGSVFSAGLNVNQVLGNDESYTDGVMDDLSAALVRLFRCPKPTVAAINGSAIAGGCILASACDTRLIADEARIGVTELRIGVSFPIVAIELLRHACGAGAEQLIFGAEVLDAEGACQSGLAHQHFPREVLRTEAMAAAERLAALDPGAYALAKASMRRSALSAMAIDQGDGRSLELQVRQQWKEDQTRANLGNLLKPKS